ncbi:hypothetical protein KC335_g15503 [Hortaea werneckii]|nr:hypothetical protein KC335_g15503 [Hortaea werneckii]
MHNILRNSNGESLDVDEIPVMELKLDSSREASDRERPSNPRVPSARKPKKHFEIAADETLGGDDAPSPSTAATRPAIAKAKKSLLEVDSSGLSALSLSDDASRNGTTQLDIERRQAEEEEMQKAIKEVERLRLEMQRAQERIQPRDMPEEGTIVKRKKPKKPKAETVDDQSIAAPNGEEGNDGAAKKKKKKKKPKSGDEPPDEKAAQGDEDAAAAPAKPKRKKKRQVTFDE